MVLLCFLYRQYIEKIVPLITGPERLVFVLSLVISALVGCVSLTTFPATDVLKSWVSLQTRLQAMKIPTAPMMIPCLTTTKMDLCRMSGGPGRWDDALVAYGLADGAP